MIHLVSERWGRAIIEQPETHPGVATQRPVAHIDFCLLAVCELRTVASRHRFALYFIPPSCRTLALVRALDPATRRSALRKRRSLEKAWRSTDLMGKKEPFAKRTNTSLTDV